MPASTCAHGCATACCSLSFRSDLILLLRCSRSDLILRTRASPSPKPSAELHCPTTWLQILSTAACLAQANSKRASAPGLQSRAAGLPAAGPGVMLAVPACSLPDAPPGARLCSAAAVPRLAPGCGRLRPVRLQGLVVHVRACRVPVLGCLLVHACQPLQVVCHPTHPGLGA